MKLSDLKRGDVVRNLGSGDSYVVITEGNSDKPPVAIRHVHLTNVSEWVRIDRATGQPEHVQTEKPE